MFCVSLLVICTIGRVLSIESDFKGFDDSILFALNWPGSKALNDLERENNNYMVVTSSDYEVFKCFLPKVHNKESTNIEEYDGPSPISLLQPLFSQKICSYRLESYWSYEVCHGRYIRQYHEEREGKQVKTQEYFLGHWSAEKQENTDTKYDLGKDNSLKKTQVEGITLPYVEIVMDEGTICDLNGKPRITRVLYVCYSHGKHEVYSFKELSTCEYEMIILSPLLCEHPHFKPKDKSENSINCVPHVDGPKKPSKLLKYEYDNLKFLQQSSKLSSEDNHARDVLAVFKVEKIEQDGETHLKLELHPLNDDEEYRSSTPAPSADRPVPVPITDDSPVRAFLNGENCLNGGSGWWKYEFCYGQHVMQYHIDRTGEKTTLLLGKFDEEAHIDWVKENPGRALQPSKEKHNSISHLYSGGDLCDKTEKPRQTEVKLKCVKNPTSPSQVSLYLLEPRTCHYILGVESPLICDILPHLDEYGLVRSTKSNDSKDNDTAENVHTEEKEEKEEQTKEKYINKFGFD